MKKQILSLTVVILASVSLVFVTSHHSAQATFLQALSSPVIEEIRMNIKYGGRAVAATVNPTNNNVALLASESGGLFRTTTKGATWAHVDTLPLIHLNDVHYAPYPNQNVVIATGWLDAHLPDDTGGIWRSPDGGTSWFKPAGSNPGWCPMTNAWSIAFGGTGSGLVYVTTSCGLSISGDWGFSWPYTYPMPIRHMFGAIAGDSNNFYVCNNEGLWRGTGTTLGNIVSSAHRCNWYIMHNLAISPLESSVVYMVDDSGELPAGCEGNDKIGRGLYEGIYNATTNQVTWTRVANTCFRLGGREPWVAANLSRDGRSNHYDVYFGNGLKTYRNTCTSGGSGTRCPTTGWQQVIEDHDDQNGIAFDPVSKCAMYLVSDGGVHKATDATNQTTCGSQWRISGTPLNGYNALQVYDLAGTNMSAGILGPHTDLYAGTQDNALWASEDGGATWPHGCGNEGYHIQVPNSAYSHHSKWIQVTYHDAGSGANWQTGAHFVGIDGRECQGMDVVNPTGHRMDSPLLMSWESTSMGEYRYLQYSEPITGSGNFRLNLGLSYPQFVPTYRYNWTWSTVNDTTYPLEDRGQVSSNGEHITYYHPYRKPAAWTTHNDPSFGLFKVTGIHPDGSMDSSRPMTLADGSGSYSLTTSNYPPGRAAWWWPSVYAVDPNNPNHLVAADIASEVMKVSVSGGLTWTTDAALTALVTKNGEYRFAVHGDQQPFVPEGTNIQAHVIGFDPFIRNHILVGTHNLGVIQSINGGQTWGVIPGTQKITNITDFFFMKNQPDVNNLSTFWVSTYGRGLWKITDSISPYLFHFAYSLVGKWESLIRDPTSGDPINPDIVYDPSFCPNCQFLVIPRGEIWGFDTIGGEVSTIYYNEALSGHLIGSNNVGDPINSTIPTKMTNALGTFADCKICEDVYKVQGNKIRGLVLNRSISASQLLAPGASEIVGIITSIGEDELPGVNEIETFDAYAPESPLGPEAPPITDPLIRLEGTYSLGSQATIGNGDTLTALASGFSGDYGTCGDYVHILIDGEEHSGVNPYPDGTFLWQFPVTVPTYGHHRFEAVQNCSGGTLSDWAYFMVVVEEEWWDYRQIYLPFIIKPQ